jgi:hypothetical protein
MRDGRLFITFFFLVFLFTLRGIRSLGGLLLLRVYGTLKAVYI